jgi:large subunit ribosomal protein L9
MDVILLKDVENLGQVGAVVSVSRGFARNYLIPNGMAALASEGQQRAVAEQVKIEEGRDRKRRSAAEEIAARHRDLALTLPVQAAEDEKLYGSVRVRDLVAALAEKGLKVEARQVALEEPIERLGVYTVPVKLHPEVEVAAKVHVVRA